MLHVRLAVGLVALDLAARSVGHAARLGGGVEGGAVGGQGTQGAVVGALHQLEADEVRDGAADGGRLRVRGGGDRRRGGCAVAGDHVRPDVEAHARPVAPQRVALERGEVRELVVTVAGEDLAQRLARRLDAVVERGERTDPPGRSSTSQDAERDEHGRGALRGGVTDVRQLGHLAPAGRVVDAIRGERELHVRGQHPASIGPLHTDGRRVLAGGVVDPRWPRARRRELLQLEQLLAPRVAAPLTLLRRPAAFVPPADRGELHTARPDRLGGGVRRVVEEAQQPRERHAVVDRQADDRAHQSHRVAVVLVPRIALLEQPPKSFRRPRL